MKEEKRLDTWTVKLKKIAGLLTQVGVVVSMFIGGLVWVNSQFSISDKFAARIAKAASAQVVAELNPLSKAEFEATQDSLAAVYGTMADRMFDVVEVRMNRQDSLLIVCTRQGDRLQILNAMVRENRMRLDTLHTGVHTNREVVVEAYRQDSIRAAYKVLKDKWRFHRMMVQIRADNADILEEIEGIGEKREKPPRKWRRGHKYKRSFYEDIDFPGQ